MEEHNTIDHEDNMNRTNIDNSREVLGEFGDLENEKGQKNMDTLKINR